MTEEEDVKTCSFKGYKDQCKRPLYDEDGLYLCCFFFSENIEGKRAEFDKTFWKEFERQEKEEKKFDFRGFVFPNNISFNGKVFKKDALFDFTTFKGEVNFNGTRFEENAGFNQVKFQGDADFTSTRFATNTEFTETKFEGITRFKDVEFADILKLTMTDTYFSDIYDLLEILEKKRSVKPPKRKWNFYLNTLKSGKNRLNLRN